MKAKTIDALIANREAALLTRIKLHHELKDKIRLAELRLFKKNLKLMLKQTTYTYQSYGGSGE